MSDDTTNKDPLTTAIEDALSNELPVVRPFRGASAVQASAPVDGDRTEIRSPWPPSAPSPAAPAEPGHNSGLNPKDAIGRTKPGTWAVPTSPLLYLGAVMEDGAAEYGLYNWREAAVDIAVYWDAMHRHLDQFRDGEIMDKKSGLPHMAHVMANCAIIMDAMEIGNYHLELGRPGAIDKTIAFLMARKKDRG